MLSLIIGLLTFGLVMICAALILLILAQLPKKDAGAGLAFGAGTAEAIFGAGAGTPLAQITKYCAGIFLGLALTLSALNAYRSNQGERLIEEEAARQAANAPAITEEDPSSVTADGTTTVVPTVTPDPAAEGEEESETPATEGTAETPELSEATGSALSNDALEQPESTSPTDPNPNN
ncbi:preprotein translocase subunit SecG [Verrucomicrobia bacterium]|jgi:protein translocase SecG subunit|nr:preprotein translocase subunit SecG [Verrucomicrobiota bacterium]MDA7657472.1 preprotein translocase subunit SecG [Verrucomicrobiota bacterium]